MTTTDNLEYQHNKDFSSFYYEECTLARLEDELLKSFLLSKKNQRFYYAQAEFFIRCINASQPVPIFVLYTEDIPEGLAKELESLGDITMKKVITNVVRRIYEAVDPDYFHINGIYGKVKWHLMEDTK